MIISVLVMSLKSRFAYCIRVCHKNHEKLFLQLDHEKFQLASDQEQGFRKDVLTKYERNQNSEYSLKSGTP